MVLLIETGGFLDRSEADRERAVCGSHASGYGCHAAACSGTGSQTSPVTVVVAGPADFVPAAQDQGNPPTPTIPAPTVSSVLASGPGIDVNGNGDINAGHVVALTVTLSEAVTVAGGTPTLALNNGGTASYVGGSGSDTLTFSYTVAAGQDTSDLAVSSFNLNGATVQGSRATTPICPVP